MFELSKDYNENGMWAYSQLQQKEFSNEQYGFRSTKHQTFVGTGFFDAIQNTITQGKASTTAMDGSTEEEQFEDSKS